MPLPEHKTMMQVFEEELPDQGFYELFHRGITYITREEAIKIAIEAYNQGTLCQHPSHGNRVGHFEEFVGTKTRDAKEL